MKKSTVHLFVFDTMSDWEYGYAIAGLNNPQFQKAPGSLEVKTISLTGQPVTSIGGLRVSADLAIDQLKPSASAMLVLPGGAAWDQKQNAEAADLAAAFIAAGTPVAAICGATAGLASRGLLDHVPHTSNAKGYIAATGYAGGGHFRDEPAVTSGHLITASAMGALEFAQEIFTMLDLYSGPTLAAWYSLYKTGDARYFGALMKSVSEKS